MLKKFIATAFLVVSLYAQTEKFQVLANNVSSENNILIAIGNVVVFSPTYYITAQKVIYDKNKNTFELFDDVVILKNNNIQTKSNYAFLDMKTDDLYQKPNMFFEQANSIWINSIDSQRKNDTIFLEQSILSSCDCVDPDWSIRVSSADYNTKDKWINSYNPRLYFKDVPVLYLPYIGFSSDTKRRTGLLIPTLGYSKREGGIYSQPIFIAPAKNYDIELIPQYRAKRGIGLYTYFRYADSINSMLKISGGYFKEKERYQIQNNLIRNDKHYGFDIEYERYNIFTQKKDHKDGLYVDINYLNNIEYKTLEDDKYKDDNERKVESKINYIYDTSNYYLGSYFRYYKDVQYNKTTQKQSNAKTLQELPKIQLHSYTRPLLLDNLLYSIDLKYTNYTRREGLEVNQYELNVPFSYSYSFFDDYLKLVLRQEFSFNNFDYKDNDINLFKDGTFSESNSIVEINSDLIKAYEDYTHTINLSANYKKSITLEEEGDLYKITNNSSVLSPFHVTRSSDDINFKINQSIYDRQSLKQIINHKLSQSILYDEFNNLKFQNLENEITYNYILGSIKNRVVYNFQDSMLIENSSSFSLAYNNFNMKLDYYMSKDTPNSGKENLESYLFDTKYRLSDDYSIGYSTDYNIKDNLRTRQAFTFSVNDKCWNLDLKYEKELEPASTMNGEPIKQNIVYLELLLKPLGGINQEYEIQRHQ